MTNPDTAPSQPARTARSAAAVESFLVEVVAELLGCDHSVVDPGAPLEALALDSLEAVIMTGDLSTWLGWEVDETLPWQVATLAELAAVVAIEDAGRAQGGAPVP